MCFLVNLVIRSALDHRFPFHSLSELALEPKYTEQKQAIWVKTYPQTPYTEYIQLCINQCMLSISQMYTNKTFSDET